MTTTTSEPTPAQSPIETSILTRPPRSLWSNAWRRLTRNRLAMASIVYLCFLAIVAIAAPVIAKHPPQGPPTREILKAGKFRQAAWITTDKPGTTGSWDYPFGTDNSGRDVYSRLVYGTRVSLIVGFIPMFATLLIGVSIGLVSGFLGGWVDNLLMRLTDIVFALPALLFFIVIQTAYGESALGRAFNGLVLLFITLSIFNWSNVARLVRGQVLSLKEKEFVEAARALGIGRGRIIVRHILPNTLGPIIVAGAFIVPGAIIAEAVLSYLGIGIKPSTNLQNPFPTSWGDMILSGNLSRVSQPWMLIAPALALASITIAFVALGDGLRDAFDPRQQD
ncbi:MAG TPA: ABC transporter permease [Herpetosiphonaceae bacterium]